MLSMEQFKELVLNKEYKMGKPYMVKYEEMDVDYFNDKESIKDLCYYIYSNLIDFEDDIETLALMVYLAYDMNIGKFINNDLFIVDSLLDVIDQDLMGIITNTNITNKICLFKKFRSGDYDRPELNPIYIALANSIYKSGVDITDIFSSDDLGTIMSRTSGHEEYPEFYDYLFNNFYMNKVMFDLKHEEAQLFFLSKMIDNGDKLTDKIEHNMDTLLMYAFDKRNKNVTSFLSNKVSLSTDKINNRGYYKTFDDTSIINSLSKMDGYQLFIQNNKDILLKFVKGESLKLIMLSGSFTNKEITELIIIHSSIINREYLDKLYNEINFTLCTDRSNMKKCKININVLDYLKERDNNYHLFIENNRHLI